jgi:hypothetical protein
MPARNLVDEMFALLLAVKAQSTTVELALGTADPA